MKAEQPETMTSTGIERLQRWAAFSVKAHCNRDSFAADLLLYDKLIVPVPDDDAEYERWMGKGWQPNKIADTVTASAGRLLPVPWTAELRAQWKDGQARLEKLGEEVAFGYTGFIYASSAAAWEEIAKSINILPAEDRPKRKPSLLAGYQSAGEARVELGLSPLDPEFARSRTNPENRPGGRSVDQVVAFKVRRLVHEPKLRDPGDAFEVAVKLADDPVFQQARQGLFDWEDRLYVDGWTREEAEAELPGLQEAYRDAVRAHAGETKMRWVETLLPKAAGWTTTAIGHPHLSGPVSYTTGRVVGHFMPASGPVPLERHPGAALEMIRAAYREAEALTEQEEKEFSAIAP